MIMSLHEKLQFEWVEYNYNWMNTGIDFVPYEKWLESQVEHFRTCSLARYGSGQTVYTEQELLDNLQNKVNEQAQEIMDLKLNNERLDKRERDLMEALAEINFYSSGQKLERVRKLSAKALGGE